MAVLNYKALLCPSTYTRPDSKTTECKPFPKPLFRPAPLNPAFQSCPFHNEPAPPVLCRGVDTSHSPLAAPLSGRPFLPGSGRERGVFLGAATIRCRAGGHSRSPLRGRLMNQYGTARPLTAERIIRQPAPGTTAGWWRQETRGGQLSGEQSSRDRGRLVRGEH